MTASHLLYLAAVLALAFAASAKRPSSSSSLPVLVQQVCRHGDRAPFRLFPDNEHKAVWVQGEGYLTTIGEELLYTNGQSFRSTWYPSLLSPIPLPNETQVVSSHSDRAIMSVASFMAGLYPPTEDYVFKQGLNWQAYPVHTISPQIDYYLWGTDCPAYDAALGRIFSSKQYQKFLAKNQAFIDKVCLAAGFNTSSVENLNAVFDNLFVDQCHNLSLPYWATEDRMAEMQNIMNVYRSFQYNDPDLLFLDTGGGPLLGLMMQNLEKKVSLQLPQKFVYYSAHDTTVLPFLGNLGQHQGPNPPYSSCGVMELYEGEGEGEDKFYVQLGFRNSTVGMDTLLPFKVPGCDDVMCEYGLFARMVKSRVNMDPATACSQMHLKML